MGKRKKAAAPGQAMLFPGATVETPPAEQRRQLARGGAASGLPPAFESGPPDAATRACRAAAQEEHREANARLTEVGRATSLVLLLGTDRAIPLWPHGLKTVADLDAWILAYREKELEALIGQRAARQAIALLLQWSQREFHKALAEMRAQRGEDMGPERSPTVALVACGGSKRPERCQAADLYTGALFRKSRALVEARGWPWYILSARLGLVRPSEEVSPYDESLSGKSAEHRLAWARRVADSLRGEAALGRVVLLAGRAYADPLCDLLADAGAVVDRLRGENTGTERTETQCP